MIIIQLGYIRIDPEDDHADIPRSVKELSAIAEVTKVTDDDAESEGLIYFEAAFEEGQWEIVYYQLVCVFGCIDVRKIQSSFANSRNIMSDN